MNKFLSIIIPAYNVEQYISKALNSIKNQNFSNDLYEVIIVDDGSTDNTKKVIFDWIKKNQKYKKNIKYFYKNNGNWGSVINYVIENNLIKNSKYTTILDADDVFANNCFFELYKASINDDYDLIISNFYRNNNNNKIKKTNVIYSWKSKSIKRNKSHTAWSIPLCKFFKTSLFVNIKKLKENVSYQDQILFHSFVLSSNKIFFIKKFLGIYLENREGSSTSLKWDEKRINLWCSNMNYLLSLKSKEISAYVQMMIDYCKRNSPKNKRNLIKIEQDNIFIFKKAKFSWLPFYFNFLAKIIFYFKTKKITKTNNN